MLLRFKPIQWYLNPRIDRTKTRHQWVLVSLINYSPLVQFNLTTQIYPVSG